MKKQILYWIEEDNCLYAFESKEKRDKAVKESDTVLRSQLVPDGLRTFTTETIYSGTINKYEITDEP